MRPFRLRQLLAVQVAAQASIFMLQIVAVPMFLSRWGAELYGAWLTLISVSYFLSQVDIGFGSAAGVAMTAAIMGGNYEYARTLFWTSLISTILVALLLFTVMVCLGFFGLFSIDTLPLSAGEQHVILACGAGVAVLAMLWRSIWSLYLAIDQQATADILINLSFVLEGLLPIMILFRYSVSPLTLAVVILCVRLLMLLIAGFIAAYEAGWIFKLNGDNGFSFRRAVHDLWGPATGYFADPLSNVLQTQGIIFVTGLVVGPAAATLVYSHRLITRVAWYLSSAIRAVTHGELARLAGDVDTARYKQVASTVLSVYFWIGSSSSFGLILLGPIFLRRWLPSDQPLDVTLLALFLMSAPFYGVVFGTKAILSAMNVHANVSRFELCLSLFMVSLLGVAYYAIPDLKYSAVCILVLGIIVSLRGLSDCRRLLDMSKREIMTNCLFLAPRFLISSGSSILNAVWQRSSSP